jgi:TonB-linked SusC/RagA family outer membrane protein
MKKLLLVSLCVLVLCVTQVFAQNRTITGTVTAQDDGLPIPGVTVKIKGTNTGVSTDGNGVYTISAPDNAVLTFSFVAYVSQDAAVAGRSTINITLASDNKLLNEVVVVGYGQTTRQAFTGSAKQVSGEQLQNKRVSNVSQALAGEVAGVRVINTSGQPGTEATIRIRGFGSVNGNRSPLIVVDGIVFTGSLNSINPNDIESTTVLKDAVATAIYGSRGANGVVIVTTITGKGKTSFIEADVNFGVNKALLPRYETIQSPEQFIGLVWEGLYNQRSNSAGQTPAVNAAYADARVFGTGGINAKYNMWNVPGNQLIDPVTRTVRAGVTRKYTPEDWRQLAFQSSARREYNVRAGGSSDKSSYFMSLGYLKDDGYALKSNYERLTGRLNLTHQVRPWLTGTMNMGYAYSRKNFGGQTADSGSLFWFADNMPSIYPVFSRDASGAFIPDPIFGGNQYDYGVGRAFGALTNSIADTRYDTQRDDRNELNGKVSLDAKISNGLTFENSFGLQYYSENGVNRLNKFYGSAASQKGAIYLNNDQMTNYTLLNLLRYKKSIGQHSFEALAAHEFQSYKIGYLNASRYNLVDNNSEDLNNGVVSNPSTSYSNAYKLESYFAQVNYDYQGKYFLTGSIRRDGSSRFVKDKWGTFGSVGAGWLVSKEDFMKDISIISNLKLKTSYGIIGETAGVGFYPGYDYFDIKNVNDQPGFENGPKANPDLTWETSKMFQVGVEFSLGSFLDASIDYYVKNTTNLMFNRGIGSSIGFASIRVNDGKLRNNGLEFDLTGHIIKNKDFRLDLNINGEVMTNKILAMPIDPVTSKQKPIDVQGLYGYGVGHSIYDFYQRQYTGVDQADGRSTWDVYYIDRNGNGKNDGGSIVTTTTGEAIPSYELYIAQNPDQVGNIKKTTTKTYADASLMYTGKSAIPDVRGAVNLSAGYKGFDLSVQMLYSIGGYANDGAYQALMHSGVSGSNNWHVDILNRWQNNTSVTDVPRLSNNTDISAAGASSRWLTKADYFSLNNVRLAYNFPTSITNKIGLGGLNVWISGDNIYFASKRKGFNTSTSESGASDTYRYSPLSTLSAGLRVKF